MPGTTRLLVPGLAMGVALSLAATRGVSTLLFGIKPYDPPTLVAAVALLVAIATVASFVSARRTASLDPLDALRHE